MNRTGASLFERCLVGARTVPEHLIGCWTRKSITFINGDVDTKTRAIWLQTASGMADIRIPADRPDFFGWSADLSTEDVHALAAQDCFAATTLFNPDTPHYPTAIWPPALDLLRFQPSVTFPEDGWLECHDDGSVLIEYAPSGEYEEEWRLSGRPDFAVHLTRWCGDIVEALYVAGGNAVRIRGTPRSEEGKSLMDLANGDTSLLRGLVDCEFSYARSVPGTGTYRIELSTLPWLEGEVIDLGWVETLDGNVDVHNTSGAPWRVETMWRRG